MSKTYVEYTAHEYGALHYRGTLESESSLPSNPEEGDVYFVGNTIYAYAGNEWKHSLISEIDDSASITEETLTYSTKKIVGLLENKQDKLNTSNGINITNNTISVKSKTEGGILIDEDGVSLDPNQITTETITFEITDGTTTITTTRTFYVAPESSSSSI